jgi:transcriptional regulator with XRE-family HTH domain
VNHRKTEIAQQLGSAMRTARQGLRQSQVAVARRVGIEQAVLSKWELGRVLPTLDDIERAEFALYLRPGALLIAAGVVELPHDPNVAFLEADTLLLEEDRRALLRLYQAALMLAAEANAAAEPTYGRPGSPGRSKPGSGRSH